MTAPEIPANLTAAERLELLSLLEEQERRAVRRKILSYYPDRGPLRRELYSKHLAFFAAGAQYRQRCMLAANRVGKTEGVGAYELTCHLTGVYPAWWTGRRFNHPIRAWACGDTRETVREILQVKLLGPASAPGTGMIPGDSIQRITRSSGVAESADTAYIRNAAGGLSILMFKSYDQRRRAFQGVEQHVILLDEEPPLDIYTECLIRTMTVGGMIMCTFTPLLGMSSVVLLFLPGGKIPDSGPLTSGGRFVVMATWDDVPHLTAKDKQELEASIPPFQRDARTKGVPQLGAGAIYPVPESDIVVADFVIPAYYPQGYALDVGWNRTAGIFGAWDRNADIVYLTGEYYRSQAEPIVHAAGIQARGKWMPGVVDPASHGRSQADGQALFDMYTKLGLHLSEAENGVESGLLNVWGRLSTGRLKVFKSCGNWLSEYRLYRRNEKGQVVKENDHLMDATRYLIASGLTRFRVDPGSLARDRGLPSNIMVTR